MDPQAPSGHPMMPVDNNKPSLHRQKRQKEILIGLGAISVILFVAVLVFASRSFTTQTQLDEQFRKGKESGALTQQEADSKAREEEKASDTRTYTAPESAGEFTTKIPKHWSLSVAPNDGSNTISGLANPDYIDTKNDKFALRFNLKNQSFDSARKSFDQIASERDLTKKKLTTENVKISGIEAVRYTGQISSKIPDGTVVLVPIRDKTFVIQTDENAQFLSTYNQILSQLKLNP